MILCGKIILLLMNDKMWYDYTIVNAWYGMVFVYYTVNDDVIQYNKHLWQMNDSRDGNK